MRNRSKHKKNQKVDVIHNSSLDANMTAYKTLSADKKKDYHKSAKAMIQTIFDCEPRILDKIYGPLELYFQKDKKGRKAMCEI